MESNILVWFGELQELQIQVVEVFVRWLYSVDVIAMQDRWPHLSQLSQASALCPHFRPYMDILVCRGQGWLYLAAQ